MRQWEVYYSDPYERRRRLQEASQEGSSLAKFDYGMACDDPRHAERWLQLAAGEGNLRAQRLLGGRNPK